MISSPDLNSRFNAYLSAYEALTADNINQTLKPLLAENVEFKDPFNHVFNPDDTCKIFQHMFVQTHSPKFKVLNSNYNDKGGMAIWSFHYKTKQTDVEEQIIMGTSQIDLDEFGLVTRHIDYWDPAEQIYEKIPLLGWLMRSIKRRLKAS